ncbi:hypothetical protein GTA08_BOTSDO04980 [Neofusicoccum parvum]|nr:hypothetical protein GTA08_BOTSDO04980 [Neofusicoccum parvum]
MPAFRDFIVRRDKLDARGQMSINAVKVEKNITCTGHKVELTDNDKVSVKAVTQMGNDNTTLLRIQPALTVWVDRVNYVSETRSVSTLIFAALNGTIEGGTSSEPTDAMKKKNHTGLQAVACDVDVNLINSSFQVGGGTGQFATISHLNMIEGPTHPDSRFGPLGDVAVWLGVVPVAMGISVHGAQPMFMDKLPLPRAYAAFTAPDSYHWKLETLHNFINVSSGALATSMHYIDETQRSNESPQNATLASRRAVKRLNPSRAYYLLIPPAIILVMIAALAFWNYWLHKRENIPIMRLADVSEVIKSSQTADIMEPAADDAKAPDEPSTLKKLSIRYGVTSGGAVGFGTSVSSF